MATHRSDAVSFWLIEDGRGVPYPWHGINNHERPKQGDLTTFRHVGREIEHPDRRFSQSAVVVLGGTLANSVQAYPTKPLPMPLKNPIAPSVSAPWMGFV